MVMKEEVAEGGPMYHYVLNFLPTDRMRAFQRVHRTIDGFYQSRKTFEDESRIRQNQILLISKYLRFLYSRNLELHSPRLKIAYAVHTRKDLIFPGNPVPATELLDLNLRKQTDFEIIIIVNLRTYLQD